MFAALFSFFAFLLLAVSASPIAPAELLAVAPHIIYPTAGTLWFGESAEHVDWDTTNIPEEAQGYTVTILLGQSVWESENLNIKSPLATQIPIMAGTASVTVPGGLIGSNYVVALIGDSGNISGNFTIVG